MKHCENLIIGEIKHTRNGLGFMEKYLGYVKFQTDFP